ncbi:MAG: thiamine phosphate synthase [Phocaeicola sp.]|nr:thiamine phosphate synthase [Phocaeicola sp.]
MKLILITTPEYFVEEDQILNALFEEGLDILHLRKPNTEAVYAERLLTLIPEKHHKKIVIHDHFELYNEYNLRGLHLNSRNPLPPDNYSGQLSASCHTFEEVKADKKTCDYVFLSPIFNSISKDGYNSGFTEEDITNGVKAGVIDKKVIALGGIDHNSIEKIKEMGFGGAAVLGGLWSKFNKNYDNNYQELINYFKVLKRLAD